MSRADDERVEREVATFLDKYFYPRLASKFQRCYDKPSQFAGIDVLVRFHGQYLNIDEKAKYKGLVNQILQFPSFELSFINRAGNLQTGWFLDNKKWTNYYAFIAVFLKQGFTSESQISYDTIAKLNVLFVNRQELQQYIHTVDPSLDLEREVLRLREDEGRIRTQFQHKRFWLKKSVDYSEQPINLVTTRKILKSLPKTHEFEVSRDKLKIVS